MFRKARIFRKAGKGLLGGGVAVEGVLVDVAAHLLRGCALQRVLVDGDLARVLVFREVLALGEDDLARLLLDLMPVGEGAVLALEGFEIGNDDGADLLADLVGRVGIALDDDVEDLRVVADADLDFFGVDVLALAVDDEGLLAAADEDEALLVLRGEVARVEPAVSFPASIGSRILSAGSCLGIC